jgi:NADP-reducing hydrogenase subunit HndB
MKKLNRFEDFYQLKESLKKELEIKRESLQIKVSMATCGIASGANNIKDYLEKELNKRSIKAEIIPTGCMGYCYAEPTIEVSINNKESVIFGFLDENKIDLIIEKYIIEKNSDLNFKLDKNFETV